MCHHLDAFEVLADADVLVGGVGVRAGERGAEAEHGPVLAQLFLEEIERARPVDQRPDDGRLPIGLGRQAPRDPRYAGLGGDLAGLEGLADAPVELDIAEGGEVAAQALNGG